ncbi:MAG: GntR family transcriptional regulator [Prevotella sp.]|nr:GntR family transcriptional regulator [Prevotella sp.]MBQ8629596.1 GntR family transcriptional regulator [Prevotella sp.]
MEKIRLGDYNLMTVVKEVDFGVYLDGGEMGEILLPARYVPEGCKPGDELDVFLYLDNEERLVATTLRPLAKVGDFACLEVAWINRYGAFLNWGLMKDLFCPFREQKKTMEIGKSYVVHVHVDDDSYRIMASARVERYFSQERPTYNSGDEVDLMIWQKTELGFKVIVDNKFPGLIYKDQIFKAVRTGDRMRGYIQEVRPDGKIDVSLQPAGRRQTEEFSDTLLNYIKDNGGRCALGDKSPAEDIYQEFGVSKKVFKKAVGDLYKKRLITIGDEGLTLV